MQLLHFPEFKITQIIKESTTVCVYVDINVNVFNKYKKLGQLGQLYGVDISNAVYRQDNTIYASCPIVTEYIARNGVKQIKLQYKLFEKKGLNNA